MGTCSSCWRSEPWGTSSARGKCSSSTWPSLISVLPPLLIPCVLLVRARPSVKMYWLCVWYDLCCHLCWSHVCRWWELDLPLKCIGSLCVVWSVLSPLLIPCVSLVRARPSVKMYWLSVWYDRCCRHCWSHVCRCRVRAGLSMKLCWLSLWYGLSCHHWSHASLARVGLSIKSPPPPPPLSLSVIWSVLPPLLIPRVSLERARPFDKIPTPNPLSLWYSCYCNCCSHMYG